VTDDDIRRQALLRLAGDLEQTAAAIRRAATRARRVAPHAVRAVVSLLTAGMRRVAEAADLEEALALPDAPDPLDGAR
jgi:hypothetical protein